MRTVTGISKCKTTFVTLALALASLSSAGHEGEAETTPRAARVLGEIHFPTHATRPEAQQAFLRGMLLLHLFEYPFAREEFLKAEAIEPRFAMAYWGEAMSFNHPIWDRQDLTAGRAALAKLGATPAERQAATPDPRERDFLASLELLYGEGSKAERDRAYLRALEQMASSYPEDHEVQLFYALALIGVSAGVRDIPNYMQSTAISQAVFCANPHHPGAAHYLIHGVDDPEHAVLGLAAARALAVMAPDAGHSLHMTSHIFNALGMWDELVNANENAQRVANTMREEHGERARRWGHYAFWLLYGYLQQGRFEDARLLLTAAYQELRTENPVPKDRMILDPDESQTGLVLQMWARYLIETRDWHGAVADWRFPIGDAFDPNLTFSYIQALRAAETGKPAQVTRQLERFRRLRDELAQSIAARKEQEPGQQLYLKRLAVMELQLQAAVEIARGETLAAARIAGTAATLEGAMPYAFGPPFVDWPAAEMQAELLLEAGQNAYAAAVFEAQLQRTKLRAASLLGLTRAQERLGNGPDGERARARLAQIWQRADASVRQRLAPASSAGSTSKQDQRE